MKDLHHNVKISSAVNPARVTDNTAQVGNIIDMQGYQSLEFALMANIPDSDATLTPLVEHGDASNLSDAAAVADDFLLGTESDATLAAGDDNVVKKVGYVGSKRYVRLTLTPASNTGNMDLCAMAIQGGARHNPAGSTQTP